MNFQPDNDPNRNQTDGSAEPGSSEAGPVRPARRVRAHYAQEFEVYSLPRGEGRPATKRARCLHCAGDWAYNETRLRTHIIDSTRGCKKVPHDVRMRVSDESGDFRSSYRMPAGQLGRPRPPGGGASGSAAGEPGPPLNAASPATSGNRQDANQQSHFMPNAHATSQGPSAAMDGKKTMRNSGSGAGGTTPNTAAAATRPRHRQGAPGAVRVVIEFSRGPKLQSRALWIAAELLQGQFSSNIGQLALIPVDNDDTFRLLLDDKPMWTRVQGQPALDYEAICPIMMAYMSST